MKRDILTPTIVFMGIVAVILFLWAVIANGQGSKTPIKNGILQSDLDAAGYKILGANMADYAGLNMSWNVVTGRFDAAVSGGGGTGTVTSTGPPTADQTAVWTTGTNLKGVTTIKGGTINQVLKKLSSTDYDYTWAADATGGSPTWGSITGTLSSQTDLQTALDAKLATLGDLSPLFTTTEASQNGAFSLTNAAATTVFGRAAGTSGAPTYSASPQFTAIGNLTTNGFVKTGGGVGTLSVDTATYQPSDADLTTWAGITPTTVGQSFVTLVNPGAITFPEISATNVVSAKTAAQLKTDLSLTATDVGLGSVTNNAQTQAAIVPNTAPTAGQILIGNVGNTAYAKNTLSGSGATVSLSSVGVLTLSAIPESSLSITNVTTGDATTAAHGFAPKGTVGTTQFWRQDWTLATPGGSGTVTASGGALTTNSVVLGAGTTDTKVVGGIITDGAAKLTLGVSTTSVGSIALNNLTSGSVTIQPATGALSTATMTIPAGATNPVVADTGAANNFLTGISTAGAITKAQPAFSNLSGNWTLAQGPSTTASALLGRTSASAGIPQEITLGTNLSMSGQTLNAASGAAGGSVTLKGNIDYTILNTDKIVATNAAFTTLHTWTMPAANTVTAGNSISIMDLQGTLTATNRLLVVRSGSDVFWPGGSITQINLTQPGQGIQFTSDGVSKWYVTYHSIGTSATPANGQVLMWDNTAKTWSISPVALLNLAATTTAGKVMQSDGTNVNVSTPTWPTAAGTAGKVVISDGTNLVSSTPTYPNAASPTARKFIVSDGTNWVASTETQAVPGTSGNILTSDGTNWTSAAPVVSATSTTTFTNKRITPRVTTISSSFATPTVNTDSCDAVTITGLNTPITNMSTNLSGTPTDFQKLIYRIKDSGTAQAITWSTSFVSSQSTLPTTTVGGKVTTVGLIYDSVKVKWVCIALDQEP